MKITKKQLKQIIKEELARVLKENTVVAKGLNAWTEDYKDVAVELNGTEISIVKIFDDLDEKHPEYGGWKNNVPHDGWDNFMSEQLYTAIEDWATMLGHKYEQPDYD
tara:strand:+ start:226 stop:546 length:321 start_codon:yes stop_codon:yes gene_type:complete